MTTNISLTQQNQLSVHQLQNYPNGITPLETQVAGHIFQPGTNLIGMLKNKSDGTVLKPLGKPVCGAREIAFYESIQHSNNSDLRTLINFVPKYYGATKMILNNKELDFIKLTDLTHNMYEPCIIDIKIGKRTWDPLATADKIIAEEEKYAECKKNLGLCIPGFQVNLLPNDINDSGPAILKRFSKDYGKQLNVKTFKDTLRLFLNFHIGICRPLILAILNELWSIQKWCKTQTSIHLYSSSILIIYDAKRLKQFLIQNNNRKNIKNCMNTNGSNLYDYTLPSEINNKTKNEFKNLTHCTNLKNTTHNGHSNNEQNIIENFEFSSYVKMIDFAHAFPSEDHKIDSNYLFGIENLVRIFEEFLEETNIETKN